MKSASRAGSVNLRSCVTEQECVMALGLRPSQTFTHHYLMQMRINRWQNLTFFVFTTQIRFQTAWVPQFYIHCQLATLHLYPHHLLALYTSCLSINPSSINYFALGTHIVLILFSFPHMCVWHVCHSPKSGQTDFKATHLSRFDNSDNTNDQDPLIT